MTVVSVIMLSFAILGAIDRLIGSKIGIGKEFEKGIMLLGQLVLAMVGMIVLAPALAKLLSPFFGFVYQTLKIEPSIVPALLFANDMGGASLAKEVAQDEGLGMFNALIVASMMGVTISFTIPFSLGCLKKEKHGALIFGLLCGVVTIPIGCFFGGLMCRIPVLPLLLDLLPLILFSTLTAIGLWLIPNVCIKIFTVVGYFIKVLIAFGFVLGMIDLLLGVKVIEGIADVSVAVDICFRAAVVLSGAFPLLFLLSKLLSKPLGALGDRLKIGPKATLGFLSTLASAVPTFEMMNEMNEKGIVLNAAFAVSAMSVLADHLAFTLAFDPAYLFPMMAAKMISGVSALLLAGFLFQRGRQKTVDKRSEM